MRSNIELCDIIYSELCATDFFGRLLPFASSSKEAEAEMMSKFRHGTIEDYTKSLHHILRHSSDIKILTAYLQNVW